MAEVTVIQGKATLDVKEFRDALNTIRNETKATAAAIQAELKAVQTASAQSTTKVRSDAAAAIKANEFDATTPLQRKKALLKADAELEAQNTKDRLAEVKREQAAKIDNVKLAHKESLDLEKKNNELKKQFVKEHNTAIAAENRRARDSEKEAQAQATREQRDLARRQADFRRAAADARRRELAASRGRPPSGGVGGGGGGGRPPRRGGGDSGSLGSWTAQLKRAEDQMNSIFRAGSQIRELGFLIGVPTGALIALGKALFDSGEEFDLWTRKAFASMQAAGTVGVTLAQVRKAANEVAQQVGAFDPTETAQALYAYQSALGKQITSIEDLKHAQSSLQAILSAATIAQIDQTSAVKGTATIIDEFGLHADRAAEVVVKLTNAAQTSVVEVSDLFETFNKIGPFAKEMNISFEEVLALTTTISDAGTKGGQAGRALSQILTSLVKPSKQASDALDEIFTRHFGTDRVGTLFRKNAQGAQEFVGIMDTMEGSVLKQRGALGLLSEAMSDLSEADQKRLIATITSQNGIRAWIPLLQDYAKFQSDATTRLREFNDNTLQIERFGAAWETIKESTKVGFGQEFNRIKETLQDIGLVLATALLPFIKQLADGAQLFNQWVKDHANIVAIVATLAIAFATVGTALAGAFMALGGWIQALAVFRTLAMVIAPMILAIGSSFVTAGAAAGIVLLSIVLGLDALRNNLLGVQTAANSFVALMQQTATTVIVSIGQMVNLISALLSGDWKGAWEAAKEIIASFGVLIQKAISEFIPAVVSVFTTALGNVGDTIESFIPGFKNWGRNLIISFANGILDGISYVVNAALGVIDVIASFFESHSPPKAGPLQFIEMWGMNLINTYMAGMKKGDFKIVDDVADLIQKELKAQLEQGRINPGQYFVKNMQAYENLTAIGASIRESITNGVDVDMRHMVERMTELVSVTETENQFIQEMFAAYANLAPIEALIEKDKERLGILQDQKDELSSQLNLMKQQYDNETFDDNDQMRRLRLKIDILKQEHRLEELGLPVAAPGKKGDATRAGNRAVRADNKAEELALEKQMEVIKLRLLRAQEQYEDKAMPLKKQEAEKAFEIAKLQSSIHEKEMQEKPWLQKLEAAKEALKIQEKIFSLAEAAAAAANKGSGGGGGGGFPGGAPANIKKATDELTEGAKKFAEDLAEKLKTGFTNALKPFTQFNKDVEAQKEEFKKKIDDFLWTGHSFMVGLGALLKGEKIPLFETGMRTDIAPFKHEGYSEHGEMAEMQVFNTPTVRELDLPDWMKGEKGERASRVVSGIRKLFNEAVEAVTEGKKKLYDALYDKQGAGEGPEGQELGFIQKFKGFDTVFNDFIEKTDWGVLGVSLGLKITDILWPKAMEGVPNKFEKGLAEAVEKVDWYKVGYGGGGLTIGLVEGLFTGFIRTLTEKGPESLGTGLVQMFDTAFPGGKLAAIARDPAVKLAVGFIEGFVDHIFGEGASKTLTAVQNWAITSIIDVANAALGILAAGSPSVKAIGIMADFLLGIKVGLQNEETNNLLKAAALSLGQFIGDAILEGLGITRVINTIKSLMGYFDGLKAAWAAVPAAGPAPAPAPTPKPRHSGGPINSTGNYFLDKGEYVLSSRNVETLLASANSLKDLSYRTQLDRIRPSMSVGGKLDVNVNVSGNQGALPSGAEERIQEATIRAITSVLARR